MPVTFNHLRLKQAAAPIFLFAIAAVVLVEASLLGVYAQSALPGRRSYITPFPQSDRYTAIVIGDDLASGLASGLEQAFKQDGSVKIVNQAKSSSGLNRPGSFDWTVELDEIVKTTPVQIAIVMIGINDARPIRTDEGTVKMGTDAWREAYGKQVERLMKKLKSLNIATYWVGMPVMSNPATNEAMETINEILREKTYVNGIRFIDSWGGFIDQFGAYSAYGPDLTGQTKRLRENDGVSFTDAGNQKLAHYVEVVMRRDLAAARTERNIPLAGDEDEQERIVPHRAVPKPGEGPEPAIAAAPEQSAPGAAASNNAKPDKEANKDKDAQKGQGGAKPDNGPKLVITPGIDPSQIATSGQQTGGEMIAGNIDEGVTALASISPANDLGFRTGQSAVPPSERIYNKVLIKGEYLPPKPGRADDYSWPQGQNQASAQGQTNQPGQ